MNYVWCGRCAVGLHEQCRAEDASIPPNGPRKAPYRGMHDYPYGHRCPCSAGGHGRITRTVGAVAA